MVIHEQAVSGNRLSFTLFLSVEQYLSAVNCAIGGQHALVSRIVAN
jgi:hypothetical protein